jgi:putative nucleotidyltransferase with HDIG domain
MAWIALLVTGAFAMTGGLVAAGYRLGHLPTVAILALLALGAERERIRLTPTLEVSIVSLLCVFTAVTLGPLAAVVVGGVAVLADLPRHDVAQPVLRWLTWTGIGVIVAGCAGLTAIAVGGTVGTGFWAVAAVVAVTFLVETTTDAVLAGITPAIRGTGSWSETTRTLGTAHLTSFPLQVPLVALLAFAYETISPWSVVLFAIPAFAAHRLLVLYRQQMQTAQALGEANARLAAANLSFATALVATLDARDEYTAGHSAAVAIYAADIAQRLGLAEEEQKLAHLCGLVHDIGKIGLPAGLLEKPGALTLEERKQMELHSTIGERILRNVDDYGEIAEIVRHHHERVDGNGYPDGLVSEEIPLLARIIAVADAYNAMTSNRPYRDAMPSRVARLRLAQAVESQFDTAVVAAFEAVLTGADEAYRTGTRSDFTFEGIGPIQQPIATQIHAIAALAAADA